MWTINDFPVYRMVSGWSTHEKLSCPYYMKINKAFTLIKDGKIYFFNANGSFCQQITSSKRIKRTSLLVELREMLYLLWGKNCMTWCQSTVLLCLAFNSVNISFLVLV